ncbi:MAG: ABC transporter ATP-binding protein [Chloroflexi bacterium]|nr:ABC transporter ATP-binding protein [Chloroflexota bacterium]
MRKLPPLLLRRLSKLEIRRAAGFVWESAPRWTVVNLALLVIEGLLPLLTLYLTKLVLDAVTEALRADDPEAAFGHVATLIALLGGVTLLIALVSQLRGLASQVQAELVTDHMYDVLHAKSIEVDLEYYENAAYYDMLHRAQEEAPFRPTAIVNGLIQIGQSSVSLLAMTGLLLAFHWAIALLMFVAAVPSIIARVQYAERLYRWQREQTPVARRAYYFNWMLTGDDHAKENRLFDLGPLFMRRSHELRRDLREQRIGLARHYYLKELAVQASATLAVFISYGFIAYRTVLGAVTLGDLVMYYQAFQRAQGYLHNVLGGLAGLYENSLFLSNLYEFLDLKKKVAEPEQPAPVPRPMQAGIVVENVSFQYPTGTRPVLENISLTIEPGKVIALVGENGSGKTTLIKLLCRLYDPTSGSIRVDGVPLQQFTTTGLRREISVIFQDYAHYQLTARENVWFGNVTLPINDNGIVAAAQHSGADPIITHLKNGYDTVLGKWFENGEELSIGEWQKIALARAFLRDSQVIVLDEPTSAMDPKAEYEIFKQFRHLINGRAAILISHRLSTVRLADCIYVLENGRIVEHGTHDDLVKADGAYARLFETQAQYYR